MYRDEFGNEIVVQSLHSVFKLYRSGKWRQLATLQTCDAALHIPSFILFNFNILLN